jgi:hypothetical protein
MALQIEDVDHAFPYGLALENLFDGQLGDPNSRAPVLGFDGLFQLAGAYLAHKLGSLFSTIKVANSLFDRLDDSFGIIAV